MGGILAAIFLTISSSYFIYERLTGKRKPGEGEDEEIGGVFIIFFPFSALCLGVIFVAILNALVVESDIAEFLSGLAAIILAFILSSALVGSKK